MYHMKAAEKWSQKSTETFCLSILKKFGRCNQTDWVLAHVKIKIFSKKENCGCYISRNTLCCSSCPRASRRAPGLLSQFLPWSIIHLVKISTVYKAIFIWWLPSSPHEFLLPITTTNGKVNGTRWFQCPLLTTLSNHSISTASSHGASSISLVPAVHISWDNQHWDSSSRSPFSPPAEYFFNTWLRSSFLF